MHRTPTAFHYIYRHVLRVVVYDPAERADTLPLFLLYPYMYSWVKKLGWRRLQGTFQESVLQLSRVSFVPAVRLAGHTDFPVVPAF